MGDGASALDGDAESLDVNSGNGPGEIEESRLGGAYEHCLHDGWLPAQKTALDGK